MIASSLTYSLAAAALARAEQDVARGVREIPVYSNHGPRVEQYQHTAGINPGDPYCAAAVYTWYTEAAQELGMENPLVRTGYCPSLIGWGKQHGRLMSPERAHPGDILVLFISSLGRFAHTGIVRENPGNGSLITCEANTNNNGARDGDGVYQKVRAVSGTKHMCITMQGFAAATNSVSSAEKDGKLFPYKEVQYRDATTNALIREVPASGLIGPDNRCYIRAEAVGILLGTPLSIAYDKGTITLKSTAGSSR